MNETSNCGQCKINNLTINNGGKFDLLINMNYSQLEFELVITTMLFFFFERK